MMSQHQDPNFDAPVFQRPWGERPATLRQMVNWAYHIHLLNKCFLCERNAFNGGHTR